MLLVKDLKGFLKTRSLLKQFAHCNTLLFILVALIRFFVNISLSEQSELVIVQWVDSSLSTEFPLFPHTVIAKLQWRDSKTKREVHTKRLWKTSTSNYGW